jgi:hypothetical protein
MEFSLYCFIRFNVLLGDLMRLYLLTAYFLHR